MFLSRLNRNLFSSGDISAKGGNLFVGNDCSVNGVITSGNLSIDNAQLFIRRDMSGKFNIASTKNNVADNDDFFKQIDISTNSFLNLPILGSIDKISANNIIINYQDDKSQNSYLFE